VKKHTRGSHAVDRESKEGARRLCLVPVTRSRGRLEKKDNNRTTPNSPLRFRESENERGGRKKAVKDDANLSKKERGASPHSPCLAFLNSAEKKVRCFLMFGGKFRGKRRTVLPSTSTTTSAPDRPAASSRFGGEGGGTAASGRPFRRNKLR